MRIAALHNRQAAVAHGAVCIRVGIGLPATMNALGWHGCASFVTLLQVLTS